MKKIMTLTAFSGLAMTCRVDANSFVEGYDALLFASLLVASGLNQDLSR